MLNRPNRTALFRWSVVTVAAAVTTTLLVVQYQQLSTSSAIPVDAAPERQPLKDLLEAANVALREGQLDRAEALAQEHLTAHPNSHMALLVAAEAATKMNRPSDALSYYARIPNDRSPESVVGLTASGSLLMAMCELSAAVDRFQQAVEANPANYEARSRLVYLLIAGGRRWESVPHIIGLIKQKQFSIEHLLFLVNLDKVMDESARMEKCHKAIPDDPLPTVGLAKLHMARGRTAIGSDLAIQAIEFNPLEVEAHVLIGYLLLETDSLEGFLDWHSTLPPTADEHPEIWFIRGVWAHQQNEEEVAARCFAEAIARNPNHGRACYRLAQALVALGKPDQAGVFRERAQLLNELISTSTDIFDLGPDQAKMIKMAELMESLGRKWEAWAWYHATISHFPQEVASRPERTRIERELRNETPWVIASHDPIAKFDRSAFPLPSWSLPSSNASTPSATPNTSQVNFQDRSSAVGLNFTYFNSDDPASPGIQIYMTTGGGVAILDYDGDGWPDVYLTQGGAWPIQEDQNSHVDRLFRNLGNGRFEDVTTQAGLGDTSYSQGATVGDYNNDGFPDLYLANIGQNRLYKNRGDGSFEDITSTANVTGSHWTCSCLMADLNGDTLPDIYDVNYLQGKVFETICRDGTEIRTCTPGNFDAEPDRVFFNLDNGTFKDVSDSAGILAAPDGKGLGIVAADFRGDGLLNLFVANDTTANFYLVNTTGRRGSDLNFSEQGLVSGLAVDRDGRAQACMGVAIDDVNIDGLLDLFVTNFYNESNTLYVQQTGNVFSDDTRDSGMRAPSFTMLGFGTQFLDGELDGLPDLVMANGHIDDWTYKNIPFKMRPQYFRKVGVGHRFEEIRNPQLGEYFQGEYLGRSLARIDWNRDGREDFAVMHLDAPVALLTNETEKTGHYVKIHLRGTASDRDAIGTSVVAKYAGKTRMRQLTAGDGYQASNERVLVLGLGNAEQVDELSIRWPSGLEQTFSKLPVNQELLILEGAPSPVRWPVAGEKAGPASKLP